MRDLHDNDDPLRGHLFWSRRGGRDLSAEVDYDRPCPVCGYNLRGSKLRSRCPECGAMGGWNLEDEAVAWDEAQNIKAFVSTCFTAICRPHLLARHVWYPARMDLPAARRFRRLVLTVASVCLILVALAITARTAGSTAACVSLPFQAIAIIVWLNAVTLDPLSRVKDWSSNPAVFRKVQAIVHYLSASMVLSILHLPLIFILKDLNDPAPTPWFIVVMMHVALLIVQLCLAATCLGWLIYELVDMPRVQAHTMALGMVLNATASAAIMLIAFPAAIAMLAANLVGN
jgi:hypothetical protein